MNIYDTYTMLGAVREITPAARFIRDRYFPTNDVTDVFTTSDVLIDYMDGTKKLAPVVVPRKGGVAVTRRAYTTKRFTPPFVAPKREMTVDDLMKRGFGEAFYSGTTPEQRQYALMMLDYEELDRMIARREEYMSAQAFLNNGYTLEAVADDFETPESVEIKFYDGSENDAVYTPTTAWNGTGPDILGDIAAAADLLTSRGLRATDLVVSPDVAEMILGDETIQKLLDNRRINIGNIAPQELPDGVVNIGRIIAKGHPIDIYSYGLTYTSDADVDTAYLPAGTAIVTAPNCGRTLYGAVTQLEDVDNAFHTYPGRRIPKYVANKEKDLREFYLRCRPLVIPNNKNAWISIDTLKSGS